MIRSCLHCNGKMLVYGERKGRIKQYCSDKCMKAAWYIRKKIRTILRTDEHSEKRP